MGKESPFASGSGTSEENPGFYWQPNQEFDATVAALRTALAARRAANG
ncbi:hypothetical protein [Amycolatopsis sp. cmx-11-51]